MPGGRFRKPELASPESFTPDPPMWADFKGIGFGSQGQTKALEQPRLRPLQRWNSVPDGLQASTVSVAAATLSPAPLDDVVTARGVGRGPSCLTVR